MEANVQCLLMFTVLFMFRLVYVRLGSVQGELKHKHYVVKIHRKLFLVTLFFILFCFWDFIIIWKNILSHHSHVIGCDSYLYNL